MFLSAQMFSLKLLITVEKKPGDWRGGNLPLWWAMCQVKAWRLFTATLTPTTLTFSQYS